ncbi:MAG: hypothetical protein ACREUT_08310 [Steroidobacteraceae bacterium]
MWRRLISPFQEFGLLCGTLYALDRVLSRLSPQLRVLVYELMVQPISPTPILPSRLARKLSVRVLERGHPDLAAVVAPQAVQHARFSQSSICLGTYSGEHLIGYVWLCFERYEEDEARCTFIVNPRGQAVFDFDLVVLPEYRMGLGFAGLWHGTNEYLRARGISWSFSRLTRFNIASRRAHGHLRWRRVGAAVIFKFWSVEIIASTIAPYLYLSPSGRSRARIALYPAALSS